MHTKIKTTGDVSKDGSRKTECLVTKLERFLSRACRAEEKQDYFRAGRCFTFALLCESLLRTDGKDAYPHILAAMPVY